MHSDRKIDVVVGRIDQVGAGVTVVSVSIHDRAPGAIVPSASHSPFLDKALAASCRTPIAMNVSPDADFADGYRIWREAFDSGRGGYFTISADRFLDVAAETLRQGLPGATLAPESPASGKRP